MSPVLDTKIDRLTDRQSQCDSDSDRPRHGQAACVEAGSNTSTVTLQVVGGDEKGSHKSETVIYSHEFHGAQT
jgi:hypothetical protein